MITFFFFLVLSRSLAHSFSLSLALSRSLSLSCTLFTLWKWVCQTWKLKLCWNFLLDKDSDSSWQNFSISEQIWILILLKISTWWVSRLQFEFSKFVWCLDLHFQFSNTPSSEDWSSFHKFWTDEQISLWKSCSTFWNLTSLLWFHRDKLLPFFFTMWVLPSWLTCARWWVKLVCLLCLFFALSLSSLLSSRSLLCSSLMELS